MNVRPDENPPVEPPCAPATILFPARYGQPGQEGRLIQQLRDAAQTKNAIEILARAAVQQVIALSTGLPPEANVARPLADLAVSGRAAFSDFCSSQPQDAQIQAVVQTRIGHAPGVTASLIENSVKIVLDRAYSVAWFLRGQSARGTLGWIAVSAEDDAPHRPVNVPATIYPQHDLLLGVPGDRGDIAVLTRFAIATATPPPAAPIVSPRRTAPPPLPDPVLPAHDQIILFITGSDSRLEEADSIIPHLVRTPDGQPSGYCVISMDLPGSGYVNPIDPNEVSQWIAPGPTLSPWPGVALLPFLERFIVEFVPALSSRLGKPGLVENRIAAVMGGSLGGNLGLRLAQRQTPWLRNIVAYSPGSVWNARSDANLRIAIESLIQSIGQPEVDESRQDFFAAYFDRHILRYTQPEMWYSDRWPCKPTYMGSARFDHQETYMSQLRGWHWRISFEELVWTWRDPIQVRRFVKPILLGAGSDDDYWPANIYSNTKALATEMPAVRGDTFFFLNTGHSIHFERPAALAGKILDFLVTNRDWTGGPFYGDKGTFFADVDGDHMADAIAVNADTVTVRRSTGASFGPNEDWTGGPYYGDKGTFFADVDGDGRADAIAVNADTVTVRRATATRFSPNEDWTHGPFYGSEGTFFADVDGDGRADAIAVNKDTVTVRRSTGTGFGPNEDWTSGAFYGSEGTFFADVDGDGRADAIAVNRDTVTVRRSTGTGFGPNEDWTRGAFYGSKGTFFADVDGDGRADAIAVNTGAVTVRRSTGASFSPNQIWKGGPFYGDKGTFFIDVDGDGRADAIAVNNASVYIRRSL